MGHNKIVLTLNMQGSLVESCAVVAKIGKGKQPNFRLQQTMGVPSTTDIMNLFKNFGTKFFTF